MYTDGLEIGGIGVGMVFLALVVILVATLGLRTANDVLEGLWRKRLPPSGPSSLPPQKGGPPLDTTSTSAGEAEPPDSSDAAKAAAIAVALFMEEESEKTSDS